MPAARPSSPSIRFTALVIPTIQRMVNGQENQPKSRENQSETVTEVMRMPKAQTAVAAISWQRSLTLARRPLISSIRPTKNINVAALSRMMTLD